MFDFTLTTKRVAVVLAALGLLVGAAASELAACEAERAPSPAVAP